MDPPIYHQIALYWALNGNDLECASSKNVLVSKLDAHTSLSESSGDTHPCPGFALKTLNLSVPWGIWLTMCFASWFWCGLP